MFLKVILCIILPAIAVYHESKELITANNVIIGNNTDNQMDNYDNDSITLIELSRIAKASKLSNNLTEIDVMIMPQKWEVEKSVLLFPKIDNNVHFKMMSLPLNNSIFIFDFLRDFNKIIMPYDVPHNLLKDALENRIVISKLISESMQLEGGLLALVAICSLFACIIPGIVIWMACRPIREDYKPPKYPGFFIFLLYCSLVILGIGIIGLIYCNETINNGIERIPITFKIAMDDLSDYYTDTIIQLRRCLTRSLDIASEAIMGDLDNIDELLGKPVQSDLNRETSLEGVLRQLLEVADASQEISMNADILIKNAEEARDLSAELNRAVESIRRDLEGTKKGCSSSQDRLLCSTINSSGFTLNFKVNQLSRDERLLRLRSINMDNLTEAARQARGEYLYIPHHIARFTLDNRNRIRRELGDSRNKLSVETRNLESSNSQFTRRLKSIEKRINDVIPYINYFEEIRWLVGIGIISMIFLIWLIALIPLTMKCRSDQKVRPALLCGVFMNCLTSIVLWIVLISTIAISSHTEMLICRSLQDPNYKTMEAIMETKAFLKKSLNVPLKDLLEKCKQNETVYLNQPTTKPLYLEEITDYWKWSGLTKSLSALKVDIRGLKILTPSLEGKLDNVLFASNMNLTDYRSKIRGPIVDRDLKALSDQIHNVARQLSNRRTAREFETIGSTMQNLMNERVKPLMIIQDSLVDQLITLEIQLRPYQRKINDTLSQLKNIQYYIDLQGETISQLKSKQYVERLNNYLDQWRIHILREMRLGVPKCPLWDIIKGFESLFCQNILGSLDGFWLIIIICIFIIMISTPTAHALATAYRVDIEKMIVFTPSRHDSNETMVIDRATWRTPDPPPLPPPPHEDSW